jgi:ABC-type uncharacterized transport system YnjBCD ATPase subunit
VSVVEARDVSVRYGDGTVGVHGFDLAVSEGDLVALLGTSGSGKSTCLGVLSGRMAATSGAVLIGGRQAGSITPEERYRWLRSSALVGQDNRLHEKRTIRENVLLGLEAGLYDRSEVVERGDETSMLERLGIAHIAERVAVNGVVVREADLNVRRNLKATGSFAAAAAIAGGFVGAVVEWCLNVNRAAGVASGTRAALSIAFERSVRVPVLLGALLAAELILMVIGGQAVGRRQRSELEFLEGVLGLPRSYTAMPALSEAGAAGLVGGLGAAVATVASARAVSKFVRSTVPVSFTIITTNRKRVTTVTHYRIDVAAIRLDDIEICGLAVAVAIGVVLMVLLNTAVRLKLQARSMYG